MESQAGSGGPFDLDLLLQPAAIAVGGHVLSTPGRVLAEHMVATFRDCIRQELQVEPTTSWRTDEPHTTWCFGMEFGEPQRDPVALVTIDSDLARALVDSLGRRAQLPGSVGPLSEVDRGALEFLSLVTLDSLAHQLESRPEIAEMALRRFLDDREITPAFGKIGRQPAILSVRVGARSGLLGVCWRNLESTRRLAQQPVAPLAKPAPQQKLLGLSVQLPSATLRTSELDALGPGDVLLLGTPAEPTDPSMEFGLGRIGSGCRVVTSTGWTLGHARLRSDTPRGLTATIQAFGPAVATYATPESGLSNVAITIGAAEVSIGDLARDATHGSLELAFIKVPENPVALTFPSGTVARGELVRVGGELGVRVAASPDDRTLRIGAARVRHHAAADSDQPTHLHPEVGSAAEPLNQHNA